MKPPLYYTKFNVQPHTLVLYSTFDLSSIWEFTEITVIEQVLWVCSSVHVEDDIVPTVTHLSVPGRKVGGKQENMNFACWANHWYYYPKPYSCTNTAEHSEGVGGRGRGRGRGCSTYRLETNH